MKLTLTDAVRPTLHLESDDGLQIHAVIDLEPKRIDRRRIAHRPFSATGLLMRATVDTVNSMFHHLDSRRRQIPEIGARMQTKCGRINGVVEAIDSEARTCRFVDYDTTHAWADVEYES